MKYKNGRTAQVGDQLLDLTTGQTGVIHSISEQLVGNCRFVGMTNLDPWVTLSECVHIDCVRAALLAVDQVELTTDLPGEAPRDHETEPVEPVVDPTDPIQPPQEPYPGDEPAGTDTATAGGEEATAEVTEQEQVTEEPAIEETVADKAPAATE